MTSVAGCAAAVMMFSDLPGRLAAMVIVVGVYAMSVRSVVGALATAVMAWLFATGFLVNAEGMLTFSRADLLRLGLFLGAGLAGCLLSVRPARAGHPMRHRPAPVLARHLHALRGARR
ncbi:hypothetical protein [Nonomuraea sediminis]|uniref:hypothetical protein n=1 Tax=Nonomuraea sediminis TaxID=2835864 RepID=UPI001BDCA7CB|nr:hypothetical protein [Nonomuraea sediminis]